MVRYIPAFILALLFFAPLHAQNPGAAGCIGFNGSTQYVNIPNATSLNNSTAITLEAWILPNAFSPNSYGNVIIGKDGWASGPQGYTLRCGGSGALSFNIGNGAGWVEVVTSNVLQTQVWQHVAGTFDGSALRIYVNGVLVGTTNYSGTISPGTYALNLARIPYTAGGTRNFQGELDEIRVWRTALSQTTIRDWMCRKVTPSHPSYGLLGGYWRFDDGSGTVLADQSPNGNNGTLMAAPVWGLSGAHIGDTSVYAYGGTVNLSIPGMNGGNLLLDNATGSPAGVHLYRVNEAPDLVNLPAGFTSFDTSHYYGAMVIGGTSPNFDLTFSYAGNAYIGPNDGCIAAIAGRAANNFAVWYPISSDHQLAQSQLFRATIGQQQFILGRQPKPYPLVPLNHVNFCPGDTGVLATTSATNLTYSWYQNGIPIPGASAASYPATQSGNYHAMVDDGTCAYATDTIQITVYPAPALSQTILGNVCTNAGVQTMVGSPTGGTFAGPGVAGSTFDPLAAGIGPVNIVYSYTDSNMCLSQDTQSVNVLLAPQVSMTTPADQCENALPLPLNLGTPGGGTYSGPGVTANVFDPAALSPGSYPLVYAYTAPNGCSASDTTTINVIPSPPTPTVSVGGNTLYSSVSTGNQWLLNGTPIPGANGNTYVPTVTGLYTVVATGANGCTSDTSMGLTYVGVDLAINLEFEAWPVPVEDFLRVRWYASAGDAWVLNLVDLRGRKVIDGTGVASASGAQDFEFDMQDLAPGIYFLRLRTPEGQGIRKILRN